MGVKRSYNSPRREQQARETREAILDAAQKLFVADGYNGTSIRAVADLASVSLQTVYNAFGDKAGLLWHLAMRIVAGAEDREDPTDTGLLDQLRAERDPITRMRMAAHASRLEWEQGLLEIESMVFNPEVQDPRLKELAERGWKHKRENTRVVVELLFPAEIRRAGIELEEVVDIVMAIDAAPTVRTLIEDCGWDFDRYEEWMFEFMINQFLDPAWADQNLGSVDPPR